MRRRRLLIIAVVPILALAAWVWLANTPGTEGGGSAPTIAIGSGTVAPGGQVTVNLTVTPAQGISVGALDLQVNYDNAVLTATNCTAPNGACNEASDADTAAYSMADPSGLSGVEGTLTFAAAGGAGTTSPLDVVISACYDSQGIILSCTDTDGQISIGASTPTPPTTPSPPPGPTPTPAQSRLWGDVDCSGVVDAIDSLKILRWKALLSVSQTQPCPVIGAPYP